MARRSPSAVPIIAAAIAGLLLILGVRAAVSGGNKPDPAKPGPSTAVSAGPVTDNSGCTTVRLAASSEKAELLKG
ncbi:MAG: hypothetical protein QOG49_23, partial [Frankiaceae bacterium]|nr:hypothetical protein [Frankiaceae bacterium]